MPGHISILLKRPAARAAGRVVLSLVLAGHASAAEVKAPVLSAGSGHGRVPDPAAEGWLSESVAELCQDKLRQLLGPLAANDAESAAPQGAFALVPDLITVPATGAPAVRRGGAAKPGAPVSLREAFAPVRKVFQPGAALHFKVKTVDVALSGDRVQTTHLIHFDGASPGGLREVNATWVAAWQVDSRGSPDKLLSLICQRWEDLESPAAQRWFSDQTLAVLRGAPAAVPQFSAGNAHYRLRLQASLPFFKFGHHGLAVADVNGDGLDDVYVCQPGGLPNRLLLHAPDHTVVDAAAAWGLDFLDSTQCALFADFDNDGDPDLAAATTGALTFLENTGRSFAARLRLPPVLNAYGLAAADYDGDGDTDLYAVRYYPGESEGGELAVPMPHFDANNGGPNFLIRNDGPAPGGAWRRFSDATAGTGLDAGNRRFSYAAVWDDFNSDGLADLYVANDFGRNNLYLQEKPAGGRLRFRDVTDSAGLTAGAFGMSASSGDFNRDGWPDIHLGAMWSSAGSRITAQDRFRPELPEEVRGRFRRLARGNSLFANPGAPGGPFLDVSASAGIMVGRWSWASLFADCNNDAWPDLLVANGFITGAVPDDL